MGTLEDPRTRLLLMNLDRAFERRSFHGTTLKGALRGLAVETAAWKAEPERNSIWELVLHAAYWKYIVRRHLTGDKSTKFPRSPSNFPRPPEESSRAALRRDIRLLTDQHALLREAVVAFPPEALERPSGPTTPTPEGLILGVAAHDVHHAGQIQLLKRLHADRYRAG